MYCNSLPSVVSWLPRSEHDPVVVVVGRLVRIKAGCIVLFLIFFFSLPALPWLRASAAPVEVLPARPRSAATPGSTRWTSAAAA